MCDQWLTDILDNGKLNRVVFHDVCKAFDSINHEILLRKLKDQFGIHSTELKWFESYLTNRKQVCSVNVQTSPPTKIICGNPQGSILGPLSGTPERGGRRGGFAPLALSQGGQGGGQKCPFINYSCLKMNKH